MLTSKVNSLGNPYSEKSSNQTTCTAKGLRSFLGHSVHIISVNSVTFTTTDQVPAYVSGCVD